ncbi:hypothetical protein P8936_16445 [Edaphobacter paludis]|uniref:Secreted protein n=1 Tax=Edaphobacter paludis TaxID=3035702 RepID=A0AAU7D7A7_9BACT
MTTSVIATIAGYFLFSAAAGAMSPPTDDQARGLYGWFFRFIQRLAANADRLAETRFPALADATHTESSSISAASIVTTKIESN